MPEKTRINHFLIIMIFLSFILLGAFALFTLIKFSPQFPFLKIVLYIFLFVLMGVPLIGSLFKTAYVSSIQDFRGGVGVVNGAAIEFLRIGKTSSRFFGMKNYAIPNSNIAYIIKSKFLFLNQYRIFYYREKSLSYANAIILFWNLEKNIPSDKVTILPGLFSALWAAYFGMGLLIEIGPKKRLNTIKYIQSIYFGKTENDSTKELSDKEFCLKGGGYTCDFRYAPSIAEMIKQQGYLGIDPLQLLRSGLFSYATWPMVKIRLLPNALQFYFARAIFNIPWKNLKEIAVNKNILGYTLTFIHNFQSAPQGIVYYPMEGDIKGVLNQIKKFTTVTYAEEILKTGAKELPKRNRWKIILVLVITLVIILPLFGIFMIRQIATSPNLQDAISKSLGPLETEEVSEEFLIYEDLNEGIRIKYPENWLKQEGGKQVTFYSPQEGKNDPYIEHVKVMIWDYDSTISIKDVDNQLFETINALSSSVIIKGEDMLSSYPANYVVFTATGDLGFEKKLKWIWTVKDNKPYIIQFNSAPDKYDVHLETVNEMINSFEII